MQQSPAACGELSRARMGAARNEREGGGVPLPLGGIGWENLREVVTNSILSTKREFMWH